MGDDVFGRVKPMKSQYPPAHVAGFPRRWGVGPHQSLRRETPGQTSSDGVPRSLRV